MNYSYIPIPEDHGQHLQERLLIISADLGQAFDYTAISVIERVISGRGFKGYNGKGEQMFYLRHVERMRGVEYPEVVDRIKQLYNSEALKSVNKAVVIDLTGLGRPVYDIMRQAGFRRSMNAINITGGLDATFKDGHHNVPKRELVSCLQIQLQNNRLKIAKGLKKANALIEELSNFQTKISDSGKDTYNGRNGVHDDIVCRLPWACGWAVREGAEWVKIGICKRFYSCGTKCNFPIIFPIIRVVLCLFLLVRNSQIP